MKDLYKKDQETLDKLLQIYLSEKSDENFCKFFLGTELLSKKIYNKNRKLLYFMTFEEFFAEFYIYFKKYNKLEKFDAQKAPINYWIYMLVSNFVHINLQRKYVKKNVIENNKKSIHGEDGDSIDWACKPRYDASLDNLENKECIFNSLFLLVQECTAFESLVLLFHLQQKNFSEIVVEIENEIKEKKLENIFSNKKINEKTVDNGLTRLRMKARKIGFQF